MMNTLFLNTTGLSPAFWSPGPLEIAAIVAVVLIVFGPGKLPDVFRALGAGMKQFKDAANGTLPPSSEQPPNTIASTDAPSQQ